MSRWYKQPETCIPDSAPRGAFRERGQRRTVSIIGQNTLGYMVAEKAARDQWNTRVFKAATDNDARAANNPTTNTTFLDRQAQQAWRELSSDDPVTSLRNMVHSSDNVLIKDYTAQGVVNGPGTGVRYGESYETYDDAVVITTESDLLPDDFSPSRTDSLGSICVETDQNNIQRITGPTEKAMYHAPLIAPRAISCLKEPRRLHDDDAPHSVYLQR